MRVRVEAVERIVLSHWHGDHSGGLLSFLRHRNNKMRDDSNKEATQRIVVDLHPDRPIARGIAPPPGDKVLCRLPEEPSFDEMEELGAKVELHAEPHIVAGGTVYVSGAIPRVTEFEQGLLGGMRWVKSESRGFGWIDEPVSGLDE